MTILRLKVAKWLDGGVASAPAEVVGPDGDVAFRGQIPVGDTANPREIDIAPGPYLIRARSPSGEVLSASRELGLSAEDVLLRGRSSAHEWLSWHEFVSGEGTLNEERAEAQASPEYWTRRTLRDDLANPENGERPFITVVAAGRQDETLPIPDFGGLLTTDTVALEVATESDPEFFLLRVSGSRDRTMPVAPREWSRIYLSVSAPGALLQHVALPVPWPGQGVSPDQATVEVLVKRPTRQDGSLANAGPIVSLAVREPTLGSVLAYLAAGDPESAAEVSRELYDDAHRLLWEKLENPYAAAAGGYVLLRTLARDNAPDWRTWPANLDDWFAWLPDGAVIHGWQLLLEDTEQSLVLARERFIEAVRRGVPIYTDGVRLLLRGLTRLSRDTALGGEDLLTALRTARVMASHVDALKPFSTFVESDALGRGGHRREPLLPNVIAPAETRSRRAVDESQLMQG